MLCLSSLPSFEREEEGASEGSSLRSSLMGFFYNSMELMNLSPIAPNFLGNFLKLKWSPKVPSGYAYMTPIEIHLEVHESMVKNHHLFISKALDIVLNETSTNENEPP